MSTRKTENHKYQKTRKTRKPKPIPKVLEHISASQVSWGKT
jgi:hypothetical protein